jgi:hypothetical protein
MSFILAGSIIAIIGGLVSAFGTYYQNKKSSEKSDKIVTGVSGIDTKVTDVKTQNKELRHKAEQLSEKLDVQAKIIDDLRKENTDLYSKLAHTSRDIYNSVTGGSSYCVLDAVFPYKGKGVHTLPKYFLRHVGNSPLRNVQVSIFNRGRRDYLLNKLANGNMSSPIVPELNKECHYYYEFATLYPNSMVQDIPIEIEDEQNYISIRVDVTLENKTITEEIEIQNVREGERKVRRTLMNGDKLK